MMTMMRLYRILEGEVGGGVGILLRASESLIKIMVMIMMIMMMMILVMVMMTIVSGN